MEKADMAVMDFDSIVYPFNKYKALKIFEDKFDRNEYVEYINLYKTEQAYIIMPELEFLRDCPTLKYMKIYPSASADETFDFSPLYEHPEVRMLNCGNIYGNREQYIAEIDFSRINGLEDLSFSANKGVKNYNKVSTLKSLSVGGYMGNGYLSELFCSKELDTLELREGRTYSLDGIETSDKMQCLYLRYNRSLVDISALSKVKKTLKALRIENCSKIEDFSVLEKLENLELLEITGSNTLPDLQFIKKMKNLKTFVFNVDVLDGDLTPCLDLDYVFCERSRKHFNLKDKDLPKGKYTRGNEDIEEWRRLE